VQTETEQRWHLESVLMLGAGLMGSIAVGMVAVASLHALAPKLPVGTEKFLAFIISAVAFQGVTLGLTHVLLRMHQRSWREFLGLGKPDLSRAVLFGVATGALVLPGAYLLNELSGLILTYLQGDAELQTSVRVLQLSVTLGQRVCFAIAAIVLAPLCEEILFRGILYDLLKQFGWPRLGLAVSSLLFGLIHANAMTLVPLSFLAVVLALLYDQTRNLMAPIVAHAVFNLVNFLTFVLQPK